MHWHKLWKHGVTPEHYERLLVQQNHVCAICDQPETQLMKGTLRTLSIDHDHNTGEIRGLLCHNCNAGLGQFHDQRTLLEAAAAYLP